MANVKIKLVKSLNGRLSKLLQRQSPGTYENWAGDRPADNPQTRGKIAQIGYLVKVTEE